MNAQRRLDSFFFERRDPILTPVQEAGIPSRFAPTVGIAVDHRRQNVSEESLAANVARLKAYKERLIVFPRRSNAPKKGDTKTNPREVERATYINDALPVVNEVPGFKEISKADLPAPIEGGAYAKLRYVRAIKRSQGAREKRARDAAEAEQKK